MGGGVPPYRGTAQKQQFEKRPGHMGGRAPHASQRLPRESGILGRPLQKQKSWQASFPTPTPSINPGPLLGTREARYSLPHLPAPSPAPSSPPASVPELLVYLPGENGNVCPCQHQVSGPHTLRGLPAFSGTGGRPCGSPRPTVLELYTPTQLGTKHCSQEAKTACAVTGRDDRMARTQ